MMQIEANGAPMQVQVPIGLVEGSDIRVAGAGAGHGAGGTRVGCAHASRAGRAGAGGALRAHVTSNLRLCSPHRPFVRQHGENTSANVTPAKVVVISRHCQHDRRNIARTDDFDGLASWTCTCAHTVALCGKIGAKHQSRSVQQNFPPPVAAAWLSRAPAAVALHCTHTSANRNLAPTEVAFRRRFAVQL